MPSSTRSSPEARAETGSPARRVAQYEGRIMTSETTLKVGVLDLRRHPGERRPVERVVVFDDLAITSARVPDGAEVRVDLELEAISEGIVATGTLTVPWVGDCRRCLSPVHGETETDIREIFATVPVEGETYPLDDDLVDLEPMIRDAALLALPLAPLCGPDCPGPAPESFPTGTAAESESAAADPRWAALDELRFDASLDLEDAEALDDPEAGDA